MLFAPPFRSVALCESFCCPCRASCSDLGLHLGRSLSLTAGPRMVLPCPLQVQRSCKMLTLAGSSSYRHSKKKGEIVSQQTTTTTTKRVYHRATPGCNLIFILLHPAQLELFCFWFEAFLFCSHCLYNIFRYEYECLLLPATAIFSLY